MGRDRDQDLTQRLDVATTPASPALGELDLRLVPVHDADPVALLRFESTNRRYFRSWISDRGDSYYDLRTVASSLQDALRWWEQGSDRLHVVVDRADEIVGRANLIDVSDSCASLGYRVAESHVGSGIATAAVSDLLRCAPDWGIRRVEAVTSANNAGSARVLERCGFALVRTRIAALELDGSALDALEWEAWAHQ